MTSGSTNLANITNGITIVTSPRTGSNLLQNSIGRYHPYAINSGDTFINWDKELDYCNVFKVFIWDRFHPCFHALINKTFTIHLYRKNSKEQIDSWIRACESGTWLAEHPKQGPFLDTPTHPKEVIDYTNLYFEQHKGVDMRISYESLVDNWDYTIEAILRGAKWKQCHIPKAHRKLHADTLPTTSA